MGLLDDAIRQHLELKRRHGADPTDVAKLEREAFGPSDRPEPIAMPDPDAPAPAEGLGAETAVAERPPYHEAHESRQVAPADAAPTPEEPVALTPEPGPTTPEPEPAAPAAPASEPVVPDPVPEAASPDPEHPRAGESIPLDDVGERTVEFSAVDAEPDPQPDAEPGEHDELEGTPEFLEETPEHDRLWFEQKPPRDFDF